VFETENRPREPHTVFETAYSTQKPHTVFENMTYSVRKYDIQCSDFSLVEASAPITPYTP